MDEYGLQRAARKLKEAADELKYGSGPRGGGAAVSTEQVRAADLPTNSIIGAQYGAFIKADLDAVAWIGTTTPRIKTNDEMDGYLAGGAQVLRVGDGTTERT